MSLRCAGFLVALGLMLACRAPSVEALSVSFSVERGRFDSLIAMLRTDTLVRIIGPGYVDGFGEGQDTTAASVGLSTERLAAYRGLMRRAEIRMIRRDGPTEVRFGLWGAGWGATVHRGVAWSVEQPTEKSRVWYSPIAPQWYAWGD